MSGLDMCPAPYSTYIRVETTYLVISSRFQLWLVSLHMQILWLILKPVKALNAL